MWLVTIYAGCFFFGFFFATYQQGADTLLSPLSHLSLSTPKVKHLTQDSHFAPTQFDLDKQKITFFLGITSAFAFGELCRGTITQFKPYAVQFEEDYDYIGPIYYFMWLLMILCTQPTQLITFSMNNK